MLTLTHRHTHSMLAQQVLVGCTRVYAHSMRIASLCTAQPVQRMYSKDAMVFGACVRQGYSRNSHALAH